MLEFYGIVCQVSDFKSDIMFPYAFRLKQTKKQNMLVVFWNYFTPHCCKKSKSPNVQESLTLQSEMGEYNF